MRMQSYSPCDDADILFKCGSNSIRYDCRPPNLGHKSWVKLKPYSESCSYLQYKVPLTSQNPYFCVQIGLMSTSSKIAIGIAGHHIRDDVHLGCHNSTVGYHSESGVVMSSHCSRSQTKPPKYTVGDTIGILVTQFNAEKSSVMVIKNGSPVCTIYHYERDHSQYFPTISMEHGPVDLLVSWHTSILHVPTFHHINPSDWLVMAGFTYDPITQTFCSKDPQKNVKTKINKLCLSSLQGPQPLTVERSYYEVELVEISMISHNPSLIICLVSCGAHLAAPSSSAYHEVLKFSINTQVIQVGDRFGWGVHYLPPIRDSGTVKQPIVCCVALNGLFQTSVCYIEPEGGYYPFIAFTSQDFRLRINCSATSLPFRLLPEQTKEHVVVLTQLLAMERETRALHLTDFVCSNDLNVSVLSDRLSLTLQENVVGIHTLQYCGIALTKERPVFQVNVTKLIEDSALCVGLARRFTSCNKYPGRQLSSLGYHSKDGKILYDGRSQANTQGHRFTEGDQLMIELCPLSESADTVMVRVWKNELPIALRYIDVSNAPHLYPTLSLYANGSTVSCEMITPNMIEQLPTYFVNNPLYWCLPPNAQVATDSTQVSLVNQAITGHCIVCPVPMSRGMHHFELRLLEEPTDERVVPPMIALTTASPYDPPRESNFQLDLLRFWPRNEAATLVQKGDTMGWGVIFPDDDLTDVEEQIVLCYLTINRDVILTRALIQPAGGLHATVVLPYGCEKVELDFDALTIHSHPFTKHNVQQLYSEARHLIADENRAVALGVDLPFEHKRLQDFYKPLPAESNGDMTPHRLGDFDQLALHSADHIAIGKSKSKACVIL